MWDLDWSPDSSRLASAGDDGRALVSEVDDGGIREVMSFSARDTSHGVTGVAFSPDGERLMTGDKAIRAVKVWDATITGGGEWAPVAHPQASRRREGLTAVDFTPDSRSLTAGRWDPLPTSIVDAATGVPLATIGPTPNEDRDLVDSLDLSDDGELLATSSWWGPVRVWDMVTGQRRLSIDVDGVDRAGTEVARFRARRGWLLTSVSFGPDGRWLALTREGTDRVNPAEMDVTIWDWERDEVVSTLQASAAHVDFDPTSTRVATARIAEGVAEVWDAQTGDRLATFAAPTVIGDIAFSPDGKWVATTHADGTVRLWDPGSGVERLALRADAGQVDGVLFSPDGTMLATTENGLLRVWRLDLDDLIAVAKTRLTRPLTEDECRQYLHATRCPDAAAAD